MAMTIEFASKVTLEELKDVNRKYSEPSTEISGYAVAELNSLQASLIVIAIEKSVIEGCLGIEISNPHKYYKFSEYLSEVVDERLPRYGNNEKVLILLTPVYEA